ncbi:hypothetical protein GGR54DRAFT_580533 [Hypoxylon sp. NC1633]|nr:hypothetical protein GGR54DRAFT_580533 [Hypoxylon sp. NC1633]
MADQQPYYYMRPGHVLAAAMGFSVVSIIAVALRFWARKIQRQPPKADDWLMIPATLLTIGLAVSQVYGVSQKALGYRTVRPPGFEGSLYELATPQLAIESQIEWAFWLIFPLALACIKASFLFFYKRVFAVQKSNLLNRLLTTFIVLVAMWAIAFFFAGLFQCGENFSLIWGSQMELLARCYSTRKLILTLCITDFITDVFIMLIPVPLVLRLQLPTSKKVAVCTMFLLGGGTVVASLVRFVLMGGSFIGSINITDDKILGVTACMYWGVVECGLGVLAACLPTIQFLFKKFVWEPAVNTTKSMFSSRSSDSIIPHKDVIHVNQSFGIEYAKANGSFSPTTSPMHAANDSNEQFIPTDGHATWYGHGHAV